MGVSRESGKCTALLELFGPGKGYDWRRVRVDPFKAKGPQQATQVSGLKAVLIRDRCYIEPLNSVKVR